LVVREQVKIGHVLWGGNQISFDNCQKIIKYDITKICNYDGQKFMTKNRSIV